LSLHFPSKTIPAKRWQDQKNITDLRPGLQNEEGFDTTLGFLEHSEPTIIPEIHFRAAIFK